jgi:hypothetical protein
LARDDLTEVMKASTAFNASSLSSPVSSAISATMSAFVILHVCLNLKNLISSDKSNSLKDYIFENLEKKYFFSLND